MEIKKSIRIIGLKIARLCNKLLLSNLNEQKYLQNKFKTSVDSGIYNELSDVVKSGTIEGYY